MINLQGPRIGLSGRYSIEVLDKNGNRVEEKCLDEQDNLITEHGIEYLLSDEGTYGGRKFYLHLGEGSTSPQHSDTKLDSYTTVSPNSYSYAWTGTLDNNTAVESSVTYTFNYGQVVGNISELGLSESNNVTQYSLITRSRIKDVNSNPTSITMLLDEQLRVTYTLRQEIDTNASPYTLNANIDGVITPVTITPNFKIRFTDGYIFAAMVLHEYGRMRANVGGGARDFSMTYSGSWNASRTVYSYTYHMIAGVSKWVGNISQVAIEDRFSGGDGTFYGSVGSKSAFRFNLNPPISKTNEDVLYLDVTLAATYG